MKAHKKSDKAPKGRERITRVPKRGSRNNRQNGTRTENLQESMREDKRGLMEGITPVATKQ